MASLIDASEGIDGVEVSPAFRGRFVVKCSRGWKSTKYKADDIEHIEIIDEDQYRSLGATAAGAIIGGLLTGGIGLLAGAAFGGRRKNTISVFIKFTDGNHVAFTETKKPNFMVLSHEIKVRSVKKLAARH
ncbi:MAG: hypothetical protein COB08_019325 [Rhodobacteraceae bacterium]|nr:hypothetical protein [Paracoccaceae bacterium]